VFKDYKKIKNFKSIVMKTFFLTLLAGLMISMTAIAQNYPLTVTGTVVQVTQNTMIPLADYPVTIRIDSTGFGFSYENTVYTDDNGYYEDTAEIPGYNGYGYVTAETYDSCLGYTVSQGQFIAPGTTLMPMDFFLCTVINPECQAYFYYYQSNPVDPYTFTFENMSIGEYTEFFWNFGDSTYSYEMYPQHTFPGPGYYNVCLTIGGTSECNDTYCEFLYVGGGPSGCENSFYYYNENDPFTLTFEGFLMNGQYAQYYSWDFGDGTTGSGQTVTHTYDPMGNVNLYMVSLTTIVMDSMGTDSCFYTSYQEVWISNSTGCESFIIPMNMSGLTVEFEGYTVSPYETQYTWEFGDGVTGTGQIVSHTYPSPGMYTVMLNTIDANGCAYDSFTQIWLDSTNNTGCSAYFMYDQTDSTTFTFNGVIYLNNGTIYPDSSTTYSWDFGDGTFGSGQTVTHYFQENPVGGYTVCLTATMIMNDGTACTSTYCEYINLVTPAFNIFGYVYLGNYFADQATVHLMTMDTLWQGVVEVQSTTIDSGGYYSFPDIPLENYRVYYVQAELNEGSAYFGEYLPTYHLCALSWEEAFPVMPIMNWPADIVMIAATEAATGSGMISGVVTDLGTRGNMENVEVVLMDSEKNPIRYMRSDDQGMFVFDNLGLSTYIIHAEIMGIHTVQAAVTLTEQNPSTSVEVQVSGDEANIVFGIPDHPVSFTNVGEIYPNPVKDAAAMDITLSKPALVTVRIVSVTGQLMDLRTYDLGKGTQRIELEALSFANGFYMMQITSDSGDSVIKKFLKQ